jgi:Ca2+-binding RTX toxin-like protein
MWKRFIVLVGGGFVSLTMSGTALAAPTFNDCVSTGGGSYNNEFNSTASQGGLCVWDSGSNTVTCDLDTVCTTTNVQDNVLVAVRNGTTGTDNDFAVAAWCNDTSGGGRTPAADFCVVVTDTSLEVQRMRLFGTDQRDKLSFQMTTGQRLENLSGGPKVFGEQRGQGDRDILVGSGKNDINVYRDELYGEAGNDRIFGNAGQDLIDGGADNDFIDGGSHVDTITAGAGDDVVGGSGSGDTITGDDGEDHLCGEGLTSLPTGNLESLAWTAPSNDYNPSTWGVTCSTSGSNYDTIYGGNGDDYLFGGAGTDDLDGGAGTDILEGYSEADRLCDLSGGFDDLNGGDGDDELVATGNGLNATLDGGGGTDSCTDEPGLTRLNCESAGGDTCPF